MNGKIMIKGAAFIIAAALLLSVFSGCSGNIGEKEEGKVSVVCTIFPLYDWVRNIVGDRTDAVDVKMLVDNGLDLHNFQPTAGDIAAVKTCDLFIYVGGGSDDWVDGVISAAGNPDLVTLDLLDLLGDSIREEEHKEGMEAEPEEDGEEEETEYDEHVWLSLRLAAAVCAEIEKKLETLDPDGRDVYSANASAYIASLNDLDGKYSEIVKKSKYGTLVFADRFPFRYMVEDYGLDYYAAFVGCSTESNASFKTIMFLAEKLDELGLGHVMVIEGTDRSIADTVISYTAEKNADILTLDSMQGVTSGTELDYLSIMEANLAVLGQALN